MEDNSWIELCGIDTDEGNGYGLQEFIQQYNKDNENVQHNCIKHQNT